MLSPGHLAGPYRVVRIIGQGGMGVVFLAEHVVLGTPAVVKVLLTQAAAHAEIVQRFVNEARAAARLNHRNIVEVKDCGQLADGQWFIALEFLDGAPLSKFIASHAPVALPIIVQILGQAANGLHAAHCAGIVHRDIKPDNLFLTKTADNDHHVTILDFGIAKLGEESGAVQTRTGLAMGTPAYMAPEQLRDAKSVDMRSDVYALGAIAFEMATGRYLWGGESNPVTIYDWQKHSPRPDPRHFRSDLPPGFAAVVSRALAFDINERWGTAQEFALALAHEVPGNEWNESGLAVLRRYANELTSVSADADTVGRRIPSVASSGPGSVPIIPPSSPAFASPSVASSPPVAVAAWQQPVPHTTTLAGSAGQSVAPSGAPAPSKRTPLLAAAVLSVGAAASAVVVLATRGEDPGIAATPPLHDAALPADAMVPTSAVAIDTDPSGGVLTVDGTPKGTGPVNILAPVGAELLVRAELAGHEPASETVSVTASPAAVRLRLTPIPPDAGVTAATPARREREGRRGKEANPVPRPRPSYNPDDVVGD